jgi:subtilisin-like proprotein convertase family protein
MDVAVDLHLALVEPGTLRITLTNPAGNEVEIFDGPSEGTEIELSQPVIGFSGDEQVVGAWTLTVTDTTPGSASTQAILTNWSLLVGSRWD